MSRPAFEALMLWSDPRLYDNTQHYHDVRSLLERLMNQYCPLFTLCEGERTRLTELVIGSIQAITNAIEKITPPDNKVADLIPILEDLLHLTSELESIGA